MTDVAVGTLEPPGAGASCCVDVRDPGNAGTVLRTADAAGVDVVVCCGGDRRPFNPKTVRSSAGSVFHVPLVVSAEPRRPLEWLCAARGLRCVRRRARRGATTRRSTWSAAVRSCSATRRPGSRPGSCDSLDGTVGIPMPGRAESLNVGVAVRGPVLRGPASAAVAPRPPRARLRCPGCDPGRSAGWTRRERRHAGRSGGPEADAADVASSAAWSTEELAEAETAVLGKRSALAAGPPGARRPSTRRAREPVGQALHEVRGRLEAAGRAAPAPSWRRASGRQSLEPPTGST